jgi:hypothetical protein
MKVFKSKFTVDAPFAQVAAFHASTKALKKLTPPPIWVQFHQLDPLAEGAVVEFTMWFIIIPIRWKAVHSQVTETGFIDTQESGPLKVWEHTHRFESISDNKTKVTDQISYDHFSGRKGALAKLFFNPLGLHFLFFYRKWITRILLRT